MVVTLRELLERIRPAGTPGAPSEGDDQRQRENRTIELAEISGLLVEFETEAESVLAVAEDEARALREQAQQQAGAARAGLADRVATATATVTADGARGHEREEARIRSEADERAARLLDDAQIAVPALAEAALSIIWDSVGPASEPST